MLKVASYPTVRPRAAPEVAALTVVADSSKRKVAIMDGMNVGRRPECVELQRGGTVRGYWTRLVLDQYHDEA